METEELAIFPLSSVVLFPGVQVPLHIFEPRYRQMTADALGGSRGIGMAVVAPEYGHEMASDPPLHPIGCAGAIRQAQELPDGRYNLVLEGTYRFRILDEPGRPAEQLYRRAIVELLEDPYPRDAGEEVARLRGRIVRRVSALVRRGDPASEHQVTAELFDSLDDAAFVNSLCQALSFRLEEKLALLDADSVPERFELLEGLLSFRVAGLEASGSSGSGTVH